MHEEQWQKIVVVHNTSKSYFLWCEENGIQLKSFLQPNNELKNAWEHIVRAKAIELGIKKSDNPKYVEESLNDALAHEYRAFFDICDWLSMTLRKKVIDQLGNYAPETITTVIPDYYSRIRPTLDRACNEIARIRGSKDIAQSDILNHVTAYDAILKELIKDVQSMEQCVPAMEEHKRKTKKSESSKSRKELWIGIIIGVIGSAVLVFGEWLISKK